MKFSCFHILWNWEGSLSDTVYVMEWREGNRRCSFFIYQFCGSLSTGNTVFKLKWREKMQNVPDVLSLSLSGTPMCFSLKVFKLLGPFPQKIIFNFATYFSRLVLIQPTQYFQWYFKSIRFMLLMGVMHRACGLWLG